MRISEWSSDVCSSDLAGDEAAAAGRQVDARLGDFHRGAWTLHRIGEREFLDGFRRIDLEAFGRGQAGCDAIDANAERRPLHGDSARSADDAEIGSANV